MKTPLKIPRRAEGNVPQGDPTKHPLDSVRFLPFYAALIIAIIGFGARLFYLQLIRGADYTEAAKENRVSLINIPAPRGVIYDRNGVQLVKNLPSYNITLTPAYLPTDFGRLQQLYQEISQLTGVPVETPPLDAAVKCGLNNTPPCGIADIVKQQESLAPYTAAIVKKNVPAEVALSLRGRQRSLPGVGISVTPQRDYPTGSLTSHIIGYLGPITLEVEDDYKKLGFDPGRDKIGYSGIEAWEQDTLSGKNGLKYIEEDVAGLEIRTVGDVVNPIPGNNIALTIDIRLQASTQAALQRGINALNLKTNTTKSQVGVAIAMNPNTGEILSMVSIPTYDNQKFATFIPVDYYTELLKDQTNPLLNQAIGGQHAPGSVFKIVMAGAALAKGVIDPNRKINDPGKIVIENKYFPNDPGKARTVVCNKPTGHGEVDMITAIAQSCNVYFYKVGGGYAPDKIAGLDIEGIYEYANYFGFNRRTGIELPGERKGLIPNRDYKRLNIGENWSTGDTYIASIGQGYVLATPLQVLDSITPYLNNGFSVKPSLIKEILDGEGNVVQPFQTQYRDAIPATPEIDPVPISAYHIDIVRRGMESVVINGTGQNLDSIDGVQFAGKSGTGEYCDNIAQKKDLCKFGAWPQHAWFLAYAPADKPEIAVVVFVYNGGEGSVTSGPIAQQILQAYFELKKTDALRTKSQ